MKWTDLYESWIFMILVKKVEVCFDLVKIRMPLLKYAWTMMVELATEMMRRTMSKERKTKLFIFSLNTYFQIPKRFYYHIYLFIFRISIGLSAKLWHTCTCFWAFEKNNPCSTRNFHRINEKFQIAPLLWPVRLLGTY